MSHIIKRQDGQYYAGYDRSGNRSYTTVKSKAKPFTKSEADTLATRLTEISSFTFVAITIN